MLGGDEGESEGMPPPTLNGATSLELMGKRTRGEAGGLPDFGPPGAPPSYPSLPLFSNSGAQFMVTSLAPFLARPRGFLLSDARFNVPVACMHLVWQCLGQ